MSTVTLGSIRSAIAPVARTATRIPLNTFAIGFGLAGLAEVWDTAATTLRLPWEVAQSFWFIAAVAWVWLIAAHLVRGFRSGERLSSQLRHPAQGPVAALVPTTGMLLASDVLTLSRPIGIVLLVLFVAAAAAFAAWMIALWLHGGVSLDSVHGGYLLPTVAAALVGADVSADAGLATLGWALFGIGAFFWVIMTVVVVVRLAARSPLPDPLVPTMAILVAPPAVAGIAWFGLDGLTARPFAAMLAGLAVLLTLVQLALLPVYRRLRFSLGFWSFTFPAAAVITDAMLWLQLTAEPGWQVATVVLLALATALIAAIGLRSLRDVFPQRRVQRAADSRAESSTVRAA